MLIKNHAYFRVFKSRLFYLSFPLIFLLTCVPVTEQENISSLLSEVLDIEGVSILSQISSGGYHSCVVISSGNVKCWGQGTEGQLGNDKLVNTDHPVLVIDGDGSSTPLSDIVQVSTGDQHTCALTSSGNVKCWGKGTEGQLGNDKSVNTDHPVLVIDGDGSSSPLTDIVQVSVGGYHSCALTSSGNVKCWGKGVEGLLGNDKLINTDHPILVVDGEGSTTPLADIVQISVGVAHTCVLTSFGNVKCWGKGKYGRLGNGEFTDIDHPVLVVEKNENNTPLDKIVQVSVGLDNTCALTTFGTVKCWGRGNFGALGDRGDQDKAYPVSVLDKNGDNPLKGIVQVSTGLINTCVLTNLGNVKCWGFGPSGNIGDGNTVNRLSPTFAIEKEGSTTPLSKIIQISVNGFTTCALTLSGSVKCWGHGSKGQLGNGDSTDKPYPVSVIDKDAGSSVMSAGIRLVAYYCSNGKCSLKPSSLPSITLPANSFPGIETTPTIYAYHLEEEDTVSLHPDKDCLEESLASGTVEVDSTKIKLTVDELESDGTYLFYLKRNSICSPFGIEYVLDSVNGTPLLYLTSTDKGIFISFDGGKTWINKTTSNGLGHDTTRGIFAKGQHIYVGTDGGLSISKDNGTTWITKTTSDGLRNNIVNEVFVVGQNIYAATSGGLSISTDDGKNWVNKTTSDGLGHNIVYDVFVIGQNIYAATDGGISISNDGGSTWVNKTASNGLDHSTIYGIFAEGQNIYAATFGGRSISKDGGSTWKSVSHVPCGLGSSESWAVYAIRQNIYVGTRTEGLCVSTDGGSNWKKISTTDGLGGNYITGVFAKGRNIYAAVYEYNNGGLSISTDGGETWSHKTNSDGLTSTATFKIYVQ